MQLFICILWFILPFSFLTAQNETLPLPIYEEALNATLKYAKGHSQFKNYFRLHEEELLRQLKEGQTPSTLFIGCSDSRFIPDLILKTKPGDLFTIRTAGNFVPFYQAEMNDGIAATIQYAVEVLQVKHIIVCGHSHCGAIEGLYKDWKPDQMPLVQKWLQYGEPAKKLVSSTTTSISKEELYNLTGEVSVLYQLENLLTYPFVKKLVEEDKIALHGWYYRMETGDIFYFDPKANHFYSFNELIKKK